MSSGASAPPPQGSRAATSLDPSQQDFVRFAAPYAQTVASKSGIPYQVFLGIAANETGWGGSSLAKQQNNYFSIKGKGPAGSVSMNAWEVEGGQNVTQQSSFRAYNNPGESFQDFVDFLHDNPRYQPALNYLQIHPNDWRTFVHMLNDEGYATDPGWADKVVSIGNQFDDNQTYAPSSLAAGTRQTGGVPKVLDVGASAIGMRYQFGGAGGRGQSALDTPTDCSGFVSWAYEQATGLRLPAQTRGIYAATQSISPDQAQPGDIVMYNMGEGDHLEHAGLYAGNGMMLHDSSINPNGGVDLTPLWSGAEFRRVPGVDPSLRSAAGNPLSDASATGQVKSWVVMVHAGHQYFYGTRDSGQAVVQDLGPVQAREGQIMGSSGLEDYQADQSMGTGQDEGDDSQVDWPATNAAALTSQRRGEQLAGYQSILDTPGMGYQVPTTADVYNAFPELDPQNQQPPPPPVLPPAPGTPDTLSLDTPLPTDWGVPQDPTRHPIKPPPKTPPQTPVAPTSDQPQPSQSTPWGPYPWERTPQQEADAQANIDAINAQKPPLQDAQPPTGEDVSQAAQGVAANVVQGASALGGAVQQATQVAAAVRPYLNPVSAAITMAPGVAAAAQYVAANGVDLGPANDKLLGPPEPGSITDTVVKKAVHGQAMTPIEAVGFGLEWSQKMNDYRADLVKSMQPPEIRDTPEGNALAQGVALATDPLNYVGLPELGLGRKIITEGGVELAPKAIRTVETLTGTSLDTLAARRALAEPVTARQSIDALQHGALALNDQTLADSAKAVQSLGTQNLKYEPLSGEQVRRTVLEAVARSDPKAKPEVWIQKADKILSSAGLDHLTTAAVTAADLPVLPGMAEARAAWITDPVQALVHAHAADLARPTEAAASAAGLVRQPAQASVGMAIHMGIGGAAGMLAANRFVDPNDPYRTQKILGAGLLGSVTGAVAPYAAGLISSHWIEPTLAASQRFLDPVGALGPGASDVFKTWAGNYSLGDTLGRQLEDEMRAAFGKRSPNRWIGLAQFLEEHNDVPFEYRNDPAAQAFLDKWRKITSWAVRHDIVPNEINFSLGGPGGPKLYVPHATAAEMDKAIQLGKDAVKNRPGRTAINPFDYYNEPRTFQTLREGLTKKGGDFYDKNVPRVFGNYFSTALRRQANAVMVDDFLKLALKNNPNLVSGKGLKGALLKGTDIVRLGPGLDAKDLAAGARNVGDFIPQFIGKDVYASPELARVLNNTFRAGGMDDLPVLTGLTGMNDLFKHNVLSGSLFHMLNEMRQMVAVQGRSAPKNMWTMFHDLTTPGGARTFWADPVNAAGVREAIRNNLVMNLAADAPGHNVPTHLVTLGLNTLGGGAAGYSAAAAAQMPDDQKLQWALKGALAGALLSTPFKMVKGVPVPWLGTEARSIVEHVSNAMWNRYIPYMKYTTYQMYAPQFGGRAAAEFANQTFGGINLLAMARSRTVQDAMKIAVLAPDWQEGWARSIGNAAFGWGKNSPVGQMSRIYWRNALVQSAFVLEGMNYALGGHSSLENDPDAQLMVDMSNMYDKFGWSHKDPKTGRTYKPYLDILGPWKAMATPLIESARWATAAGAQAAGIDPTRMPLGPEIAGSYGKIPEPDPANAWKSFLGSRTSWLATTGRELWSNSDWAGRPVDQPGDPLPQQIANRVAQAGAHMLPTGESQLIASGTRGDPAPIAVASGLFGLRTKNESDPYFTYNDQYVKDLGVTTDYWQQAQRRRSDDNAAISQQMDLLQGGMADIGADGKLTSVQPGESKMTAAQRENELVRLAGHRVTTHESLSKLIDEAHLSPEDRAKYTQQLNWLDQQTMVGGTDAPADMQARPDLDRDELFRLAWNRDPQQIAELQGQQPPDESIQGQIGGAIEALLTRRPGATNAKDLSSLRARWTQETALQWNIDPAVMEDMVKAHLYQMPDGEPPKLPGVTSTQLDDIVNNWEQAGRDTTSAQATLNRQQYLYETAQQLGVDEQALATRVKLRTLPVTDQTDAGIQRSQALDLLNSSKEYPYVGEDGQPMGGPAEWKIADAKLLAADPHKWKTSAGVSVYFNADGSINEDITRTKAAKDRATAQRYADITRSPNRDAYERWFGEGRDMTDAQWQQYQAGTLPMWDDNPTPAEAKNRNAAMRLQKALTPADRLNYMQGKDVIQMTGVDGTGKPFADKMNLAVYLRYINKHKTKQWEAVGMDPSAIPGVSSEG